MTALLPAGRRAPRGLTWTVLRVHRTALVLWGLSLAGATDVLLWMYAIGDAAREGNVPCATPARAGYPGCASVEAMTADDVYASWMALITTALTYAILPVAGWAGGALVGRELENGTARLAWTQSVTPAHWLAAKLAVPAVLLAGGTGALVLLNNRVRGDDDPDLLGDWYNADVFVGTGPAAVAYALAGLALGAFAGLLLRRALPAAGAAVAAALVLCGLLERLRDGLWPPSVRTATGTLEMPRSADVTSWDATMRDGVRHIRVTYHPESHFWPLQLVESGILLAVTAAVTLAAFWLLRRRTP